MGNGKKYFPPQPTGRDGEYGRDICLSSRLGRLENKDPDRISVENEFRTFRLTLHKTFLVERVKIV